MQKIENIPKHWQVKQLGEECKCITGTTPPKKDVSNYGNEIPFVKPPQLFDKSINDAPEKLSKKGAVLARILPIDSVLVTCIGNLGRTAINKIPVAFNQQINAIIPSKNLNGRFLFYQAQSLDFKNQLEGLSSATTIAIVNKSKFETIKVIIPPLPEQQAIVAKIEELFSDLENGKQQLQIAHQQLKIYRQSLLKWAFEGKLTNKNIKDDELPKGWKWVTLGQVCNKIGDIDHKMPKQLSSGYPYVSTKDFTNNLKISFDNAKYISKEDYLNLSKKIRPERGDIIFPRYGTIGKNILIDFDKEFLVSYSCAVVKPNHNLVISKYVYLYTLSPKITEEIRKYTVETTQANVGIASIKSFVFPLPPIAEQQLIIDELESKLTVSEKIEETICQSFQHAETLKQSILKKAFEGKLI